MAHSAKVLIRELNNLQQSVKLYQSAVAEGKDVEFNKEQLKHYQDESAKVRALWLNAADTEDDADEPVAAVTHTTPVVGASAKPPRSTQPVAPQNGNGVL